MMNLTTIEMHVSSDTKHEGNRTRYVLMERNNEALTIKVDVATTPPNLSYLPLP
jgi:hypothetical protein